MTVAIKISFNETNPQIPPGKLYQLKITSQDEFGNKVNPVFFVQTLNPNISLVDSSTDYISDNKVKLYSNSETNITIQLQTVNGRPWSFTINVTLSKCPPGFYFKNTVETYDKTSHNGTAHIFGECICTTGTTKATDNHGYCGLYQCDQTGMIAYMHAHFWGGTADCLVGYCIKTNAYYRLPTKFSKEANISNTQSYNRHRRLCGRCKPGYYVSTKFPTFECYKCDRNDTILNYHRTLSLILLKCVPFTIFMLVIIFFNKIAH